MTDLRHPRHARVRTGAEYERVFKRGKRVALPAAALHWCVVDVEPPVEPQAPDAGDATGEGRAPSAQTQVDSAQVDRAQPLMVQTPARRGRSKCASLMKTARLAPVTARLGLAVSRKVDPDAVGRNRIKRVWRDAFRHLRLQLPVADFVLVARPPCRELDNAALRALLSTLLRRAGALPLPVPAVTLVSDAPDLALSPSAPTSSDSMPTAASAEPLRP